MLCSVYVMYMDMDTQIWECVLYVYNIYMYINDTQNIPAFRGDMKSEWIVLLAF